MTWWEILIIIAVAAFVVGYIVFAAVRRKRVRRLCRLLRLPQTARRRTKHTRQSP